MAIRQYRAILAVTHFGTISQFCYKNQLELQFLAVGVAPFISAFYFLCVDNSVTATKGYHSCEVL